MLCNWVLEGNQRGHLDHQLWSQVQAEPCACCLRWLKCHATIRNSTTSENALHILKKQAHCKSLNFAIHDTDLQVHGVLLTDILCHQAVDFVPYKESGMKTKNIPQLMTLTCQVTIMLPSNISLNFDRHRYWTLELAQKIDWRRARLMNWVQCNSRHPNQKHSTTLTAAHARRQASLCWDCVACRSSACGLCMPLKTRWFWFRARHFMRVYELSLQDVPSISGRVLCCSRSGSLGKSTKTYECRVPSTC